MKLIPLVELEIKDWLGMMDHIRLYDKGGWGRTPKTINIYQSPSEKIVHIQEKYPIIDFYIGKRDTREIEINLIPKIFFGQCTKRNFEEYTKIMNIQNPEAQDNLFFIPGCPADHNEGIKTLLKLL